MTEHVLAEQAHEGPAPVPEVTGVGDVLVEPVGAVEQGPSLRPLLPLAAVVSCALHAAAIAAVLISTAALPEYGVLQEETDALSVELTQSVIQESTMRELVDTAAAAAAAMPQGSVASQDAEPEPLKAIEPVAAEKALTPETIKAAAIDPSAVEASEEPLEVLLGSGEPAEAVAKRAAKQKPDMEQEERRKKRRDEAERERAQRQAAGGTTSRSNASTGAASARASASRGSVLSYAARVRAKVASNKPSGRGHRGTARVSFGVSSSGGLSYARLARSSGNAALDQAALSAVRRAAPFGAPPPGTSAAQLRFAIPFYFH